MSRSVAGAVSQQDPVVSAGVAGGRVCLVLVLIEQLAQNIRQAEATLSTVTNNKLRKRLL